MHAGKLCNALEPINQTKNQNNFMRKFYPKIFLCTLLCMGLWSVQAQNVEVNPGAGSYATLNAAFAAINAGTHTGNISINIVNNTTEPAASVPLVASGVGAASYTAISIQPVGGNFSISSAATPTASRGMIELYGADNVTIDGDDPATPGARNLSFVMATSTSTGVGAIRVASASTTGLDGANNNTIKNCIITGSRSSAIVTTVSYGINMSNSTSITTGAYSSINTVIENNLITRCYYGIYANGASATYPNTGTVIRNNVLGSATSADNIGLRGILISYSATSSGSALIENNDIRAGDYGATGYSASIAGIEIGTANYGISVRRNNIHDINQPSSSGWGAHGIIVSGSVNNTLSYIENNFIRDCKMVVYQTAAASSFIPTGIYFSAGATGVNFNHNTIVMNTQLGTGANFSSFCVNASVAGVGFNTFLNNILVNNATSTFAYGFYTAATANISAGTVNNNNYYVPGGHIGYYSAANRSSFAAWQTGTGKDAAGINENPTFVSATDLHLNYGSTSSAFESGGASTATTNVFVDYDNQVRPGPSGSLNGGGLAPDIGADEFDGAPGGPSVTVTQLTNNCAGGSRILTASITSLLGVPTSGVGLPVAYWRINAGTYSAATAVYTSGSNYEFTIGAGSVSGDVVQYYIAAQDLAATPNVTVAPSAGASGFSSNPPASVTVPTTPYSYSVLGTIAGVKTVGVGGDYATLTAAAAAYNSNCLTGVLQFNLIDASYPSETFPIVFNNNPAASSVNALTIKVTQPATVITGALAGGALVRILGNYITLDGAVSGTTRDLTISNTSTTSPGVVLIGSTGTTPVHHSTLKNTVIINGAQTSSAVVVSDGTTAGTAGYFNDITLQNNDIRKAYIANYINAVAAPGNGSGLVVSNNSMITAGTEAVRLVGIYVQGVDGAMVNNNSLDNFETATGESDRGIWLATGTINTIVRGNTINGLGMAATTTFAPAGILVSSGVPGAGITLSDNVITNLSSAGTSTVIGIYLAGATSGVAIAGNKISNIRNTNTGGYPAHGIYLASTSTTANTNAYNNFVSDVRGYGYAATYTDNGFGITVASGAGYGIYYNTVDLNTDQTTAATTAAMHIASTVTLPGAVDIRNNIFSNSQTVGGTGRYAIYSAAASSVFSNVDHNNYYTTGSSLGYLGSARATLADLQAGFGGNVNSLNIQPFFMSATDLHLDPLNAGNNGLDNKGIVIAGISTDIDNQARGAGAIPDPTAPDMGADEFTAGVVPVTLEYFRGSKQGNGNLLDWKVSCTNTPSATLVLERSADGRNFNVANTQEANAVRCQSPFNYKDLSPLPGINYYRLKMLDADGKISYSNTVALFNKESGYEIVNIMPNPVAERATLQITSATASVIEVLVTDIYGKQVQRQKVQLAAGSNQVPLNFRNMAPGTYQVTSITEDGQKRSLRFVKQ